MLEKPAVGSVLVHFRYDDMDSQTKIENRNVKLHNELDKAEGKGKVERTGEKMDQGKEGKMCS